MKKAKRQPIPNGTLVETTAGNIALQGEWVAGVWGKRKWAVRGEIIAHETGHGLCYQVKHEDGTEAFYDPSEFKVLPRYLFKAISTWVTGWEHPSGGRDEYGEKSATTSTTFHAPTIKEARLEAKHLLAEFKEHLPGKRYGSLSWQKEDAKITKVVFAKILTL